MPIGGCTAWTFTGTAYLATVTSTTLTGPSAPIAGDKAIWLNEYTSAARPRGEMSRTVSGLTAGRSYTVSATAWTDDVPRDTGLGLQFGSATPVTLFMAASSGPQTVSQTVCAQSSTLALRLFENGTTTASPVVTQVTLTDKQQACDLTVSFVSNGGSAVAPQTGIAYDALATQPTPPTRAGFVFDGWYADAALSTAYDFSTPVKENKTLYAKWVPGPGYTVSGTIVGLAAGQSVGLSNSGNGDATSGTGSAFAFTVGQASGAAYGVQISTQPPGQTCTVTQNGTGSIPNPGANVTNVVVECIALPVLNPPAKPVPASTPWGLALLGSALAGWGLRRKRRHKTA